MDRLYLSADSVVHRLAAQVKLVSVLVFVIVVVAIPAGAWPALLAATGLVLLTAAAARIPGTVLGRRLVVEVPFVVFALVLPFVAHGERVQVGPVGLSADGLIGAGTLLIKATTGVLAGIVLAATTTARELLVGVERLRLPAPLVAIASFMIRYASVVTADLARMRTARSARGFGRRRGWDGLRVEAAGAAALFLRNYERGERIQVAMLARGYTGRLPTLASASATATAAQWAVGGALPVATLGSAIALGAW